MKKLIALILALALTFGLLLPVSAEEPAVLICDYFHYTVLADGSAEIVNYVGGGGNLTVPASLDGHPVTRIGPEAFAGCPTLVNVTLPEGLTIIDRHAFAYCTKMKSITLPESLTGIGHFAFMACDHLAAVTIPDGVTALGVNPFLECGMLKEITVSPDHPMLEVVDGVLFDRVEHALICCPIGLGPEEYTIPEGTAAVCGLAFSNCKKLRRVIFPNSVLAVDDNPFCGCSKLADIIVSPDHPTLATPEGVLVSQTDHRLVAYPMTKKDAAYSVPGDIAAIGPYAFQDCTALTRIDLPEGLADIAYNAFNGCRNLTEMEIPETVTEIGAYAFYGCRGLTALTLPAGVADIGVRAFEYYDSTKRIYRPLPKLTVTAAPGSFAEAYCLAREIPCGTGEEE